MFHFGTSMKNLVQIVYHDWLATVNLRRTSTTGFKRKLKWEENGADLGSFARPTGLPNFGGVPSSSVKDKEIQGPQDKGFGKKLKVERQEPEAAAISGHG